MLQIRSPGQVDRLKTMAAVRKWQRCWAVDSIRPIFLVEGGPDGSRLFRMAFGRPGASGKDGWDISVLADWDSLKSLGYVGWLETEGRLSPQGEAVKIVRSVESAKDGGRTYILTTDGPVDLWRRALPASGYDPDAVGRRIDRLGFARDFVQASKTSPDPGRREKAEAARQFLAAMVRVEDKAMGFAFHELSKSLSDFMRPRSKLPDKGPF